MQPHYSTAEPRPFHAGNKFWIVTVIGLSSFLPASAVEQDNNSAHKSVQSIQVQERYQRALALEKLARSHEKRPSTSSRLESENPLYIDETASRLPTAANNSLGVAVGDVDGDGDLDIIISNEPIRDDEGTPVPASGQNRLLINDSTGKFVDETTSRLPVDDYSTSDFEFGDVDGDGDLDLFATTNSILQPSQLLINDGAGVFSDETPTRLPEGEFDRGFGHDAEFGDLDGDGDLDIVIANGPFSRNRLWMNDGSGTYADGTESGLPPDSDTSWDLDLGDADSDGDLDIIVANGFGREEQNRLLVNNGESVFSDETSLRLPVRRDISQAAILVDVDGDKDLDIFVANTREESRLLVNDGTGKFSDETATRLPAGLDFSEDVTAGDVDNDGDIDLFVADVGQDELLINEGAGFYSVEPFPVEGDYGSDAEFADFNSDGILDLVVTNIVLGDNNPQNRIYINTRAPLHSSVDSQNTLVEAAPLSIPADGKSISKITIIPKDATGNNLGKSQRVVVRSSAGILLGAILDAGNGTYTQELQASPTPGTASITVFVNGVKIADSPQIVFGGNL